MMKRIKKRTKICIRLLKQLFAAGWIVAFLLTVDTTISAQSPIEKMITIAGFVEDAIISSPLAGASISSSDSRFTAMTDETGSFTIQLPENKTLLIITAPGFETREIAILAIQVNPRIKLFPARSENYYEKRLGDFGNRRLNEVSYAFKNASVDNLASISVETELQNKLLGDLRITKHSGSTANGAMMLIRGINSLNAKTQPLIIIDGVILENQDDKTSIHLGNILAPLSSIDVNDIQSISVLKDGTSLYGSKGGNGVIMITTKRGRSMATKITASSMIGINLRPNITPMMNADQYRLYLSDIIRDKKAQDALSDELFLNDDPNYIYYNKYHNNTVWSDGVYSNSATQSYNIGVNGGDDIALYNLSLGFTQAISPLKNNHFNRLNARFNSDINLTEKLMTRFDISYSQVDRRLRNDGIEETPSGQINAPGYLSLIKSPFLSPYQFANTGEQTSKLEDYDFMQIANPYAIIEYGVGNSQTNNFNLALVPTYTIHPGLSISSRFSYSLSNLSENFFSPMYGVAPYRNETLGIVSYNQVKTQFAKHQSLFSDTRINWQKESGAFQWQVNAGVRYLNNSYKSDFASGHNTGSDQVKEMSAGLNYKTVGGIDDPYKSLSYYGLGTWSYKEKYILEAGLSAETTSRFGSQTQSGIKLLGVNWGIFPSLNGAWLITSEQFMQQFSSINLMKLRAGIGLSGNDGIPSTVARTYFNTVRYAYNAIGLQIHNIANPHVQWETVTKANFGLDLHLLAERLQLSVDVFSNTTDHLLVEKKLNPITGLDYYWSNDGKLSNQGFEFNVRGKIIETRDFHLSLSASAASYKNTILALPDGDYTTPVYGGEVLTAVGQSIGQFYGYQTNGVYATAEEAQTDGLSMRTITGALLPFEAGDVRFINQNGDNVIDENDKVVIGNANPLLYGNMALQLQYKRLSLQVIANYSYRNDVYNHLRSQLESGSTFYNQSTAINNRWIAEGQITRIPRSTYDDPKGNNRFSDRWIEDGSYLRLKTLQMSYELPVRSNYLQGLTVWASANNLWTLTRYLGVDPEFSPGKNIYHQGIDTGLLPQSQSFYAGIKMYL